MVPRLASLLRPMRSLMCRLYSWNSAFISGSMTDPRWAAWAWCNTFKLVPQFLYLYRTLVPSAKLQTGEMGQTSLAPSAS